MLSSIPHFSVLISILTGIQHHSIRYIHSPLTSIFLLLSPPLCDTTSLSSCCHKHFPPSIPLPLPLSVVLQFAWHSARKSCSALRPRQTDQNAQDGTTINTEVPQRISTCKILYTSWNPLQLSLLCYDRFGCVPLMLCLINHIVHLFALLFKLNSSSVCHIVSEEICLLIDMPLGACRRRNGFFLRISYG